ncbi:MAG: DNA mismatch repair protein MutS, partial [Candidatus Tectomicrobia bacterium]|nr:DNA mismatch repair protein MutS [Candidatus Tectomicrobia bacterium]
RTLFATHYHELTALADSLERVQNFNAAVREWGEKIIFLRKILPGSADRSYGIHVARLAGLPLSVIDRARQLLGALEASGNSHAALTPQPTPQRQLSLFEDGHTQLLQELRALSLDDLSPRQALDTLADLQQRAQRLP